MKSRYRYELRETHDCSTNTEIELKSRTKPK